jgi:ATP-dependent helicase HrpB
VDLAGPLLEVLAWGGNAGRFDWFEAPPPEATAAAMDLLERLGAVSGGRLTPDGQAMHRLPLHPRLARVLLGSEGDRRGPAACAVLAEGWRPVVRGDPPTTDSDVLSAVDRLAEAPPGVKAAVRELLSFRGAASESGAEESAGIAVPSGPGRRQSLRVPRTDEPLLRALLAGFPDRVARRREPGSVRLVMSSGSGALLGRESGVREAELLVALEVGGGAAGAAAEPVVRVASRIEREWLEGVRTDIVHRFDEAARAVRAFAQDGYDRLLLGERPVPPDPGTAAALLAEAIGRQGLGEAGERLRRRLRVAGLEADLHGAVVAACAGRTTLPDLAHPEQWLHPATRSRLDRQAPERLALPSGRTAALEYREDGSIGAAVKLQELFGLAETPRVGPGRVPVVFELLAPNGRPVQTTRDLRSFWERTYPEVRRELRGRYPKHPWPEDPWTAPPTHRTTRRPR